MTSPAVSKARKNPEPMAAIVGIRTIAEAGLSPAVHLTGIPRISERLKLLDPVPVLVGAAFGASLLLP